VLLAFINPSGPTHETQESPVLIGFVVLISAPLHIERSAPAHSLLRGTFSGKSTLARA
jgi:hypothetical protein